MKVRIIRDIKDFLTGELELQAGSLVEVEDDPVGSAAESFKNMLLDENREYRVVRYRLDAKRSVRLVEGRDFQFMEGERK